MAQAAPTPGNNFTSISGSPSRSDSLIMQSATTTTTTTRRRSSTFSEVVEVREFERQEFEDSEFFIRTADCDGHAESSEDESAFSECLFRARVENRRARRSATGALGQTIDLRPTLNSKIIQRRQPKGAK